MILGHVSLSAQHVITDQIHVRNNDHVVWGTAERGLGDEGEGRGGQTTWWALAAALP